jgi:hypothetical protein
MPAAARPARARAVSSPPHRHGPRGRLPAPINAPPPTPRGWGKALAPLAPLPRPCTQPTHRVTALLWAAKQALASWRKGTDSHTLPRSARQPAEAGRQGRVSKAKQRGRGGCSAEPRRSRPGMHIGAPVDGCVRALLCSGAAAGPIHMHHWRKEWGSGRRARRASCTQDGSFVQPAWWVGQLQAAPSGHAPKARVRRVWSRLAPGAVRLQWGRVQRWWGRYSNEEFHWGSSRARKVDPPNSKARSGRWCAAGSKDSWCGRRRAPRPAAGAGGRKPNVRARPPRRAAAAAAARQTPPRSGCAPCWRAVRAPARPPRPRPRPRARCRRRCCRRRRPPPSPPAARPSSPCFCSWAPPGSSSRSH